MYIFAPISLVSYFEAIIPLYDAASARILNELDADGLKCCAIFPLAFTSNTAGGKGGGGGGYCISEFGETKPNSVYSMYLVSKEHNIDAYEAKTIY